MSLYDELGGAPAIEAAVDLFYRKVLADDRINHFFKDMDMDQQIAKQRAFLTMAFGGPTNYSGRDMRKAHSHLGLTDEHMDAVVQHLGDTLNELGIEPEKTAKVVAAAEGLRNEVLNRR